ncbi:hypothetical protein BBJ28_00012272 [Nothophytophthora sp. Chile5]|nr:hypothetical protein BBJ28_00012272 [Nothophytophthora sp. Chile5]
MPALSASRLALPLLLALLLALTAAPAHGSDVYRASAVSLVAEPSSEDVAGDPLALFHARHARLLVHENVWGVIATVSVTFQGAAYANVLSYSAVDLAKNPNATVALSKAEGGEKACYMDVEDPTCWRLSLTGKVAPVKDDQRDYAERVLFSKHPQMKHWPKKHNFRPYVLEIEHLVLLDFYGAAKHVANRSFSRLFVWIKSINMGPSFQFAAYYSCRFATESLPAQNPKPKSSKIPGSTIDARVDWTAFAKRQSVTTVAVYQIRPDQIDWKRLSRNQHAVHFLEEHLDSVDWSALSGNPGAVYLLQQHLDKIDWHELSGNPNAISILERNLDNIDWSRLCANHNAADLLEKHALQHADELDWTRLSNYTNVRVLRLFENHENKIHWRLLSRNPAAIPILQQHLSQISLPYLCTNPRVVELIDHFVDVLRFEHRSVLSLNPDALPFLEQHLDQVVWEDLSANPNGFDLLEQYPDKISWVRLTELMHPGAMELLEQAPPTLESTETWRDLFWGTLSGDPRAIPLLEKNQGHIDWESLSMNPGAVHMLMEKMTDPRVNWTWLLRNEGFLAYDYEFIRRDHQDLHRDLVEYLYAPERLQKWLEGNVDPLNYLD